MIDKEPLNEQFLYAKERFKGFLILFQVGSFYESFGEQAFQVSKICSLKITKKGKDAIAMCGFPITKIDEYCNKIAHEGFRVVVFNQVKKGSSYIRKYAYAVTPALVDNSYFNDFDHNFLACVTTPCSEIYHIAWQDHHLGLKFVHKNLSLEGAKDLLYKINPSEIIYKDTQADIKNHLTEWFSNEVSSNKKDPQDILDDYIEFCNGIVEKYKYNPFQYHDSSFSDDKFVKINQSSRKYIDIFGKNNLSHNTSLKALLDGTQTPFGKRILHSFLSFPLRSSARINKRLDIVDYFYNNSAVLSSVQAGLSTIGDATRALNSTLSAGGIASIATIGRLLRFVKDLESIKDLPFNIQNFPMRVLIAIEQKVDLHKEVFFISANSAHSMLVGQKEEALRRLNVAAYDVSQSLGFEVDIKYSNAIGHCLFISQKILRKNSKSIPELDKLDLIRIEDEGVFYKNHEIRELEMTLFETQKAIEDVEKQLLDEVVEDIKLAQDDIKAIITNVGMLDTLAGFASVSLKHGYVRPVVNDNKGLYFKELGHPDSSLNIKPNNALISSKGVILISGPNMSGKSTYLRCIALAAIMAHIGCYVPCKSAKIGILDAIYIRMGNHDSLAQAQSTFMVEMSDISEMVRSGSSQSLFLIDEICTTTSSSHGIPLSFAILEYIANVVQAKAVITTHYWDLLTLAQSISAVKFYKTDFVVTDSGDIELSYTISPGVSKFSSGIMVAKKAKLPEDIINRAKEIASE